jgi:G3E family GTPase
VRCIPAAHGNVHAHDILETKPGTDHVFSATARHDAAINSFVLRFDRPVPRARLQHFIGTLVDLRGKDLLRVKGIVPVEEGLVLVQGVRHVFDRLRPVEQGEPGLVFITSNLPQAAVEALWRALERL